MQGSRFFLNMSVKINCIRQENIRIRKAAALLSLDLLNSHRSDIRKKSVFLDLTFLSLRITVFAFQDAGIAFHSFLHLGNERKRFSSAIPPFGCPVQLMSLRILAKLRFSAYCDSTKHKRR
jgi:hypothetical protein